MDLVRRDLGAEEGAELGAAFDLVGAGGAGAGDEERTAEVARAMLEPDIKVFEA